MFDLIALCKDFAIDFKTAGHKHCKIGWVNIKCPFCEGNPGYHLGFHIRQCYFNCYRCGSKSIPYVLKNLLKQEYSTDIYSIYGLIGSEKPKIEHDIIQKEHRYPDNTSELSDKHRQYLIKRGFEPDKLIADWNLKGTGNFARLDVGSYYNNRILIPIVWQGRQVSFQGRDITGNSGIKYKACSQSRELVRHQHILYGREEYWGDWGICVEGVVDVWRMGFKSFAVFGIKYTNYQVREIVRLFKKVAVVFDGETQAQQQADNLIAELRFRGVFAIKVVIEGDPGEKTPAEIKQIKNEIMEKLEV